MDPLPPSLEPTTVQFPTASGERVPGSLYVPTRAASAPTPAILLIHEILGLTPHIESVAARFAREGYVVLAPGLFFRQGDPDPATLHNREQFQAFRATVSEAQAVADLHGAYRFLAGHPAVAADRIAALGFCFGGRMALLLAGVEPGLRAAVSFYGGLQPGTDRAPELGPLPLVPQMQAAIQGHYGEEDAGIPVDEVAEFVEALETHEKTWEFFLYEGAAHSFFNDTRPNYHPEAAAEAWDRTLAFLAKHLGQGHNA
jgi:carboxymethylenebutenolidase